MPPTRPLVVALLAAALAAPAASSAQNLRVIPVPWVATDPTVPHFAYNGHPTTFKAIARGGNGTYTYEWDFTGDGVYDSSATTSNRYDLSTRFTFPDQAADMTFQAKVRVTSNGQSVIGTYPVRVFSEVPSNPALANDWQLQIMRGVAIDDGLWYLHNQMTRTGFEEDPLTGAQIAGWVDGDAGQTSERVIVSGSFLEALGHNLHFPAFPAAYLGEMPDPAANAARWALDPYAEDAARMVNYLMTQATVVIISASDEVNLTGFYPEVSARPIPDTDDGYGLFIGPWTGYLSNALRGLAVSNLTGFVAQVGDANRVLGRRFEVIVQQMVDALVWAQNDGGSYPGSWYYTPNGLGDMLGEYAGGTLDAVEALWEAERSLARDGLVVPNLVKARNTSYVFQNINPCPAGGLGGSYVASYNGVCDFGYSPAILFSLAWVGANANDSTDTRFAFPSYSGITRGQLRTQFDGALLWINTVFNSVTPSSIDWDLGFVTGGDFDRADGLGDHWAMLHWTRAARAVEPELVRYGTNDHARLFARYLLGNQATDGGWNWTLGATHAYNDMVLGSRGRAAMALLTLSRHGMAPTAVATASATAVAEGSPVTFTGQSFAGGDATYRWDFGNGQSLEGQQVSYAFPDDGSFDVALTVTTAGGVSVDVVPITVGNLPPAVDAGPAITILRGGTATFAGTAIDPGAADTLVASWLFGDGGSASTLAASHVYDVAGVYTATLTVGDDDLGSASDTVTVTVLNVAPAITSTPPTTHLEGGPYTYTLTFTDPDPADVHLCSAPVAPAGATLTGCTLTWTPTWAQLTAPAPMELCVADDAGGSACQPFEVAIVRLDADADGLPDSWELLYFGATAAQDGGGDADADGVTNAEEYAAGLDPTGWDGPGVPTLLAPTCASKVTTAQPTLLVGNAVHPTGAPLTYEFELYEDAALTAPVTAGRDVPSGAGFTAWQVDVALTEDATYYWRARAGDGAVFGPWTADSCALGIDAVEPPPAETPSDPGGCGCSGAGAGGSPTALLGGIFAVLLRRRRSRPSGS